MDSYHYLTLWKAVKGNSEGKKRRLEMGHERDNIWKPKMKKRVGYSKTHHTTGGHWDLWEEVGFTGDFGKKWGSLGFVGRSEIHWDLWEEVGFKFLNSLIKTKKCTLLSQMEACLSH